MDEMRERRKQMQQQWLNEKKAEESLNEFGVNSNQKDALNELTLRIAEQQLKNKKPIINQDDAKIELALTKEVEGNTCAICYELMIPPKYSPILLFPCGHTFCKTCTIDKSNKLILSKCALCRNKIQSYAPNLSLQNLICTFTNNKHLIKEVPAQAPYHQEFEERSYDDQYEMYALRCSILEQEMEIQKKEIGKIEDEYSTYEIVVESLIHSGNELDQQIKALTKKQQEVENQLERNNDYLQSQKEKLEQSRIKLNLLQDTLQPLQKEKEKYFVLRQKK